MTSEVVRKVALVTGAGRGLGRAVAVALAQAGWAVAANDLTPINLDVTMGLIAAEPGQGREYMVDICKRMPVQGLVDMVLTDWGRIDCLVNCASVMPRAAVLEMDEWDWQRTLDVNLSGAFYLTQRVGRVMVEQGAGLILHFTLVEGCDLGAQRAAFLASKAGLQALAREAARELAPAGVRVETMALGALEKVGRGDVANQVMQVISAAW